MWDELVNDLMSVGTKNTTGNTLRCNGFNLTVKYASKHLNDDHDDHVWRRTNVECDLKNTIPIVKHRGGTIMLWVQDDFTAIHSQWMCHISQPEH